MPIRGARIEVHSDAIARLLKSEQVADWVLEKSEQAADAAGPGFEAKLFRGFDRVSGIVRPATNDALTAFFDDSTILTRALGAVRGG